MARRRLGGLILAVFWIGAVSGEDITSASSSVLSTTKAGEGHPETTAEVVNNSGGLGSTEAEPEASAGWSPTPEAENSINDTASSAHPEAETENWSMAEYHTMPTSESEPRSEYSTAESLSTPATEWPEEEGMRLRCSEDRMISCNTGNHERCYVHQGQPFCACLSGYEKDKQGVCRAIQFYKAILGTFHTYTTDLDDKNGDPYKRLASRAKAGLEDALQASRLSSIYMHVKINDLVRTDGDDVAIVFEIVLPSSYAPKGYVIRSDLKEGIRQVSTPGGGAGGRYVLGDSGISILEEHLDSLNVTAVDPCSSPRYHYCDARASCHATYPMGFVCSCPPGYVDKSLDQSTAPGEVCKRTNCRCQNGGQCEQTERGNIICRCKSWYLGRDCSIDGKLLFITLNAVIGGLVIVSLIVCCACLKKMQRRQDRGKKILDAAVTRDFPAVITYKMPSTWMERWSHPPDANHKLNGKHNLSLEEPSGHRGLAMFRRSDEYLSIPRPHVRTAENGQGPERGRDDQNKEHWAWTMQ